MRRSCDSGKKLKLSSDGGDSGRKKCKRSYGGACGGVWRSLESGDRFCVGAFGRNQASRMGEINLEGRDHLGELHTAGRISSYKKWV
jgi:hypothetical protein